MFESRPVQMSEIRYEHKSESRHAQIWELEMYLTRFILISLLSVMRQHKSTHPGWCYDDMAWNSPCSPVLHETTNKFLNSGYSISAPQPPKRDVIPTAFVCLHRVAIFRLAMERFYTLAMEILSGWKSLLEDKKRTLHSFGINVWTTASKGSS